MPLLTGWSHWPVRPARKTRRQFEIEQRGASVIVGDLPTAWGDPAALEQVFANLIGNALNYLDAQRPGVIEVGCDHSTGNGAEDGLCTYYVKDNGLGIPEAYQHKIFQAF